LAGEIQRALASVRDQLANIRAAPGIPSRVGVPDSVPSPTTGGERLIPGATDPEQLFQTAFQQLDRGSLRAAQAAFNEFLGQYPGHERAADAHFYLADILEQQDRPEDALEGFRPVPTLYPTHERVPDAMFRMARLQLELGDRDAARATLERITNTYPNAPIAMLARDMLETIG
jgi:tol-pal system protein YbgF